MKKETFFRHLMYATQNKINEIDYGYMMSCEISSEFTPAPDYDSAAEYMENTLKENGYTILEFLQWVGETANRWQNFYPFNDNPYADFAMDLGYFECPVCGQPTRVHSGDGVCPECEEEGFWMDPLGGVHHGNESDPAEMYK